MKRYLPFILLAGDLLALGIFVYIGQTDHGTLDPNSPLASVLFETGEFALPWVIVGWLLGAFQERPGESASGLMGRSLNTWLVAGPLALFLRAIVMQRENIPTAFFGVALSIAGAFVLAWRLLFVVAERFATRTREPG